MTNRLARKGYVLALEAKKDLKGIAKYTQDNFGKRKRDEYLDTLDGAFSRIVQNPDIGRNRDDLTEGVRSCVVASHIVFYRLKEIVEVMRIVHQSEDYESNLANGNEHPDEAT